MAKYHYSPVFFMKKRQLFEISQGDIETFNLVLTRLERTLKDLELTDGMKGRENFIGALHPTLLSILEMNASELTSFNFY